MTTRLPIDEESHLALRHGERPARAELLALMADDPALAEREAEWIRQDMLLRTLYGPVAEQPVPGRHAALIVAAATRHSGKVEWRQIAAALLFLAVGGLAGWAGALHLGPASTAATLPQEALRAHAAYVAEVAHPVEVPATEKAHLVTWFSKRLGHPVSVPDLAAFGFRFLGGRIVPERSGVAALMMYENSEGIRITVYVTRESAGRETAFRFVQENGSRVFWWLDEEFGCAVVGDISRDSLHAIAVSAYEQLI
ncbi:anti-sigma factor family protein [Aestuariivirga sp.]|uniref:anti-sigma factor family protein n=1 Tax=Aestuariivirga sp. TaxID=2650926 RepID=UPI00391BAC6F